MCIDTPTPHGHAPVLPEAVLDLLDLQAGRTVFDGTLGRGGHAALIIPHLGNRDGPTSGGGGRYLATDLDAGNLEHARRRLAPLAEECGVALHLHHGSFADAAAVVADAGLAGVDAVLADLGFASNHVDDPARGFSFKHNGPLDMRMNAPDEDGEASGSTAGPNAADLVNGLPQDELADLIYQFGEERLSRRIARKIVEHRRREPIQSTGQLARIVRSCYPPPRPRKSGKNKGRGGKTSGGGGIDPATRTFQALRIAVNGELDALDALLAALPDLLNPGGRAAIISFHSLEDRRVKHAFLKMQQDSLGERLTRKPLTADDDEAAANPRSRSAKLRGFRFND